MKQTHKILLLAAAASAALPMWAMPIGLRTAVWGISASNGRTAVARLLPRANNATEVKAALGSFNDTAVEANIKDTSEYEEFREWAIETGARADALSTSSTAWLSFAADSPVLVAEPKADDLTIDEVSPMRDDGRMEMVFSLGDVAIGRNALESRLKSVFGVSGATTLDKSAFSENNLSLSLSPTDDGRVKATIEPRKLANGSAPSSFFMRVKVK